jgi:hypothetical protein
MSIEAWLGELRRHESCVILRQLADMNDDEYGGQGDFCYFHYSVLRTPDPLQIFGCV